MASLYEVLISIGGPGIQDFRCPELPMYKHWTYMEGLQSSTVMTTMHQIFTNQATTWDSKLWTPRGTKLKRIFEWHAVAHLCLRVPELSCKAHISLEVTSEPFLNDEFKRKLGNYSQSRPYGDEWAYNELHWLSLGTFTEYFLTVGMLLSCYHVDVDWER